VQGICYVPVVSLPWLPLVAQPSASYVHTRARTLGLLTRLPPCLLLPALHHAHLICCRPQNLEMNGGCQLSG
jgi:hypothetical protein